MKTLTALLFLCIVPGCSYNRRLDSLEGQMATVTHQQEVLKEESETLAKTIVEQQEVTQVLVKAFANVRQDLDESRTKIDALRVQTAEGRKNTEEKLKEIQTRLNENLDATSKLLEAINAKLKEIK